nr:hypothetical protein [Micromonospora aurantiaca]
MIERGSGRTSGLTDWRLMDVLSMWACVQDQDTTGQWKQVAGWRKVCDLALAHLSRLREYRRGLAEAWPPETNTAARAYIAELDQLIDRVQRTHDAAAANYDALAAAARAIGSARAELQPLHEEYAKKLRQKQAYEATVADPKAVAGSRLPERPPVTDDDLEQLNVRARGLMTGLSGELQHAQVMLRQPPPKPKLPRQTEDTDTYASTAPIIPPVVPVPTSVPDNPQHRAGPVSRPAAISTEANRGPVLGGISTGVAPPTPSAAPGLPPHPGSVGPTGGGAFTPPIAPITGSTLKPPTPNTPGGIPPGRFSGGSPPPPPKSAPIGGVIGGGPAVGLPPTNGGTSGRRVNPVGGVIGGGGAGTAPTGGAGSRPGTGRLLSSGTPGAIPLGGGPGSTAFGPASFSTPTTRAKPHTGTDDEKSWDPDDPWQVTEGVDPVMRPPDDRPPDPGPAIGLDR